MLRVSSQLGRCALQGNSMTRPLTAATTATIHVSPLFSQSPPPQTQQLLVRWKHSVRQIKRFQNHPARIRTEQRLGIDRTPTPMPPPKFNAIWEPTFLPNGWSAPPGPEDGVAVPEYPFTVARTKNKPNESIGFLPVYSETRKDGSKITTRVKKVSGDRELFIRELRSVLELPPPKNGNQRLDPIRIRVGGTIEVKGNRSREIKGWLAGLGF